MKTPTVVSVLATFVVVPCFGQSPVPADLQTAMTQRAAALRQADAATWARLTADNFVVVSGNGVVQTKAERVAQIKAGQPNGPSGVEHETVQVYGTTALQRFQSPGDGVWITFVWAKERTGWRVAFAQLTPITPDSASVWHAIDEANARFADSFKRGDAAAMAANYAGDGVVMMANGPVWEGAATIRQGYTQFLNDVSVPNVKLTTREIIILPYAAIERGSYELTIHSKSGTGADVTDQGKYITVWQREADGSWKIARDISNSDHPARQ